VRGLRLPPEVQTAIRAMHPELRQRVRTTLDHIRAILKAGKPLKRELSGWWSLRVGRVRIIYRETGTVIEVGAIGPRSSIYRDAAQHLSTKR
jgi:mRNA interferase RelE/StbE